MGFLGFIGGLVLLALLFLCLFALRAALLSLDFFRPAPHKRSWPLKTSTIDSIQHGILLSKPINHLSTRGGFFDSHIALAALVQKCNKVKTNPEEIQSVLDSKDENLTTWLPEFFAIPPKLRTVKILEDLNRLHDGLRRFNLDSILQKVSESSLKIREISHDDLRHLHRTNELIEFLRDEYLRFIVSSSSNFRGQVLNCLNEIRDALESYIFYAHIFGEPFAADEHRVARRIQNQYQQMRKLVLDHVKCLHGTQKDRGQHDGSYLATLVVDLFQGDRGISIDEIVDHMINVLLSTFDSSVALCAWTLRNLTEMEKEGSGTSAFKQKAAERLFESRLLILETMRVTGIAAYTARFQVTPAIFGKTLKENIVMDLWPLVASADSVTRFCPQSSAIRSPLDLRVLSHSIAASRAVTIASLLLSVTLKHYNVEIVAPVTSSASRIDLGLVSVPKI